MSVLSAVIVAAGLGWAALTIARHVFDHAARPDIDVPPGLDPLRDWIT